MSGPAGTNGDRTVVRVAMPGQLRALAGISGEASVEVAAPPALGAVLDALEADHPTLVGAIRDRVSRQRRPMIRIYADGEDLTDAGPDRTLPEAVASGREPVRLVGAIAGG